MMLLTKGFLFSLAGGFLFSLAGGLSNRVRGGAILHHGGNDSFNSILFGLLFGILVGSVPQGLLAALCMHLGASFGWGVYIGAVGGWEKNELKEVNFIDFIIRPFRKNMKLWGFLGLSLRGLLWGLFLAVSLAIDGVCPVPTLILSSLMGTCYYITTKLQGQKGWETGEILYGTILWASVFISVML